MSRFLKTKTASKGRGRSSDFQEVSGCQESALDPECAGWDSLDQFDSKTAALYGTIRNTKSLTSLKSLLTMSSRDGEAIAPLSRHSSFAAETSYSVSSQPSSSCQTKQNPFSKIKSVFSFRKRTTSHAGLKKETNLNFTGKSGVENTPTVDLSKNDEKQLLQLIASGVQINAQEALKSVMEVVISLAIIKRCTKDNTLDLDEAQKRLHSFSAISRDSQRFLLGLIWEVNELDEITKILNAQDLSFDNMQGRLLQAVTRVDNGIHHINEETEKHTQQLSSKYYAEAVQFFDEHKTELKHAADKGKDCLGEENYRLLKIVCKKLTFGAMHETVRSLNVELEQLAKDDLYGFIFYPDEGEASLKARPCLPFPERGAKRFGDHVKAIKNFKEADYEDPDKVHELFDHWDTLAKLFLSLYLPELAEGGLAKSQPGEDYFDSDISLTTKLFVRGEKTKGPRAMSLFQKFKGVLEDHQSLKQDKGELQEENERLKQETEELRARIREIEEHRAQLQENAGLGAHLQNAEELESELHEAEELTEELHETEELIAQLEMNKELKAELQALEFASGFAIAGDSRSDDEVDLGVISDSSV